ncbi:MAG: DUF3592 domain-containing protein, partial [Chloroflexota bacterium]
SDKKTSKAMAYFWSLFFIVVGGLALAITFYFHNQLKASESWPSTPGIVIASFIEEYRDAEQVPSYNARVQYQYSVDSVNYSTYQVKFGIEKTYANQNGAGKALAVYPVGQAVTVYYDAADPSNAVLDRTTSQLTVWYIIGGLMVLIGLFWFTSALRN